MGIVAGAVAVLALIGGGIFFLLSNRDGGVTDSTIGIPTTTIVTGVTDTLPPTTVTPPTTLVQPGSEGGFPTAKAAVEAVAPADWVLQLADETAGQAEYWSGPPQSEWVTAYLVEETSDGTWSVVNTWDLGASDVPATEEDEARYLVDDFLFAVMYDDADYAHSLTVEPFASDPASAQYSNGNFIDFNIVAVEAQSDGTYWVKVEEEWSWGVDRWRYHAVPTEIGWRINDLRTW